MLFEFLNPASHVNRILVRIVCSPRTKLWTAQIIEEGSGQPDMVKNSDCLFFDLLPSCPYVAANLPF